MNATRVIDAVREVDRLRKALRWLRNDGALLHSDLTGFEIRVSLSAGGKVGSPEAAQHLSQIARLHIGNIMEHAIKDAENSIAMAKSAIEEELVADAAAIDGETS